MRLLPLIIICVCAITALALYMLLPATPKESAGAAVQGKALIGGAFEAVDHTGAPITEAALKGHFSIVYFGFTHCPDICPTGLLKIANAMDAMGDDAAQVTPYFVSVDPERDTPKTLAAYVEHFHPRLVGITGSLEQINTIADAYKVYYKKREDDSALGYLVDHSGFIFLMDKQGEYIRHFSHNASETEIQNSVQNAIGGTK